jgi:twinkle protein
VEEGALSAHAVIEAASPRGLRSSGPGKRGLVIDPWNELEHWRPANLSETEYVSKTLSSVRNWARRNRVHVWIVAHPQKMRREDGKLPIPTPDMISGSQHWWNKADCAITVWRDFAKLESQETSIYVQKVRFKHIGRPGIHHARLRPRDWAVSRAAPGCGQLRKAVRR